MCCHLLLSRVLEIGGGVEEWGGVAGVGEGWITTNMF